MLSRDKLSLLIESVANKTYSYQRRSNNLYASDLWCSRKAIYSSLDVNKTKTLSSDLFFSHGTGVEQVLLDALELENILVARQLKMPDFGLSLSGYCDAIALYDNELRIVEVKSCATLPESASYSHERQALNYSAAFAIPRFDIVYMTRNVSKTTSKVAIKCFNFKADAKRWDSALTRMIAAHVFKQENFMPPRHREFNMSHCSFCDYKVQCYANSPLPLPTASDDTLLKLFNATQDFKDTLLTTERIQERYKQTLETILDKEKNSLELSKESIVILQAMLAGVEGELAKTKML